VGDGPLIQLQGGKHTGTGGQGAAQQIVTDPVVKSALEPASDRIISLPPLWISGEQHYYSRHTFQSGSISSLESSSLLVIYVAVACFQC